jgi:hypothetical protein
MHLEAALVVPTGWKASPEVLSLTVPPLADGREDLTMTIPESWDRSRPRVAVAGDVMVDGKYLGEVVEVIVDIDYS